MPCAALLLGSLRVRRERSCYDLPRRTRNEPSTIGLVPFAYLPTSCSDVSIVAVNHTIEYHDIAEFDLAILEYGV